jgi:phage host-nuclease inhibitor protein Gam
VNKLNNISEEMKSMMNNTQNTLHFTKMQMEKTNSLNTNKMNEMYKSVIELTEIITNQIEQIKDEIQSLTKTIRSKLMILS